jgi:hypothetical protein
LVGRFAPGGALLSYFLRANEESTKSINVNGFTAKDAKSAKSAKSARNGNHSGTARLMASSWCLGGERGRSGCMTVIDERSRPDD